MEDTRKYDVSASTLHILAMVFMLGDHLWATVVPGNQWLNSLGRLAFPLFAFMIVEGYFHTRDLKRYALRLFLTALVAEIPFDLMYSGSAIYPFHQNAIWTLLLGLGLIHINELAAKTGKLWLRALAAVAAVLCGFAAGFAAMVDYYGAGVVTVLVFYFFRRRKWQCLLGQIAALYYLNVEVVGGLYFEVSMFGAEINIVQQGFALLALIPIWMYRGRQGLHDKVFKWTCYTFYPAHMLALYLCMRLTGS